jgi:transcriptional regulator with XRE-family HTH domain
VAAEVGISKKTLSDYETGHREPPKRVVVLLDNFYTCNGELIKYWLKNIDFSQLKKIRMFGRIIRILRKYVFGKL